MLDPQQSKNYYEKIKGALSQESFSSRPEPAFINKKLDPDMIRTEGYNC